MRVTVVVLYIDSMKKILSSGFAGSTTRSFKEKALHEIESRMKKLQLIGSVQAKWGRVEIHKHENGKYQTVTVGAGKEKEGPKVSDLNQAREYARQIASKPSLEHALQMHLDVFTDDFSPPETGESDIDADKLDQPFGDKHTDTSSKDSTSKLKRLSYPDSDGDENKIDIEEFRRQAGIKPVKEQFPGSGDNAEFDPRLTDPQMMGQEERDQIKRFHLKRLSGSVDESKWEKAKKACIKEYGHIKWPVVMHIYENMGGK